MHNSIYFDIKCEPFGVKKVNETILEQIKSVE